MKSQGGIRTATLSCFDTSSIPTVSLDIATEISSFVSSFPMPALRASFDCDFGSPARMVLAYSFASKTGDAKTLYESNIHAIKLE